MNDKKIIQFKKMNTSDDEIITMTGKELKDTIKSALHEYSKEMLKGYYTDWLDKHIDLGDKDDVKAAFILIPLSVMRDSYGISQEDVNMLADVMSVMYDDIFCDLVSMPDRVKILKDKLNLTSIKGIDDKTEL
jgi:hypothetical protein